ncbi:ethanolamine ammonia-lyase reactivating factor EutA [Caloramator sp. Dgby_cultured_2]|uniref:ethanolamine ammonia-lyase reactivating factor EutA n=1 Tax=Caloramator sp. Dgby_cultured_2 TaxID=3029174 RepID=UPI003157F2E9
MILGLRKVVENKLPLIVIVENDFAKALGHSIFNKLNKNHDVICIDGIKVENGDFVDIGKPVSSGRVVPVVIKTLLFK